MIHTAHYVSPVGDIQLAERGGGLIGLWIEGQKYGLRGLDDTVMQSETPVLNEAAAWLDRYFAGEKPPLAKLKLSPVGGAFRQAVWEMLCAIPYGEVTTYGALARQLAARDGKANMSAQAVGGAVGHNPISIIIPCHRVVGAGGNLTGYAGGLDKKVWLLTHEGVDMTKYYIPKKGTAL